MFNGEQINIFPKMFCVNKGIQKDAELDPKHLMKNLIRWLEYCSRSSYPFINISTDFDEEDSLKELFITLYVSYVKNAIERGAYYQYIDESSDIAYIKGRFDVCDYFLKKLPNGKADHFRCTYSKFEFDNDVNRIIKYTCRLIYPITSPKNQQKINNILTRLSEVSDVKCIPSDCDKIRLNKTHNNFRIIISMSKLFLQNESIGLNFDFNETFCFLFPTDLLFEGFIGGFIHEVVKEHKGKTYIQKSDMYLIEELEFEGRAHGKAFKMKHDIMVEYQGGTYILDTKYKAISRFEHYHSKIKDLITNEVEQGDIYQVCEYARKRDISDVFLLFPMYRYEEEEPNYPIGISRGASGDIRVHFIRLPFIFEADEDKTRKMLKGIIEEALGLCEE